MPSSFVARKPKKGGWFVPRSYPHFDYPWSYDKAAVYVADCNSVRQHAFLPFLSFTQERRRYSTRSNVPLVKSKLRSLAVPSHVDGCIFSWYSHNISILYEKLLSRSGLHQCVLAYRSKSGSNITFARDAFDEIDARRSCLVLSLDLKDFFPIISYAVFKANWAYVLGSRGLPADHYAVFRAITAFAQVERDACYQHLGIDFKAPIPRPLCSPTRFRSDIRAAKLIKINRQDNGIPQGSQISALLSNVYMIHFDVALKAFAANQGGSYRRYSDDLLLILPYGFDSGEAIAAVETELNALSGTTKLNIDKTEVVQFHTDSSGQLRANRNLQYLGFTFDGQRRLTRSSTLSKYSRRLVYAIRSAKNAAKKSKSPVFKRDIYRRFTHLGNSNFVSRYCRIASQELRSASIRRQMRRHMHRVKVLLDGI